MHRYIVIVLAGAILAHHFPSGALAADEGLTGEGVWQSVTSDSVRGTWTVELSRTGNRVEGTMKLTGSNVLRTTAVTGSLEVGNVVLGVVVEGSRLATFTGSIDGGYVSGEWSFAGLGDDGVWYGSLKAVADNRE